MSKSKFKCIGCKKIFPKGDMRKTFGIRRLCGPCSEALEAINNFRCRICNQIVFMRSECAEKIKHSNLWWTEDILCPLCSEVEGKINL